MLQPNPHLSQSRQRKEALPEITRLSLAGETTRQVSAQTRGAKTVIRWPKSLRRDCATKAVAQSMEIIDELIDGYKTIYGKAMEGWDRSQEDKEIRTVVDSGLDDSKKIRSLRTETRPGNPACLGHARGALDSIGKLLGLNAPAQVKIEEEEVKAPYNLEEMTIDDIKQLPSKDLRALMAYCTAVVELDRRGEDDPAGVHEAGLADELAPPEADGEAGPRGDGAVPAADGVPPAAAREERDGEPPLPGVSPQAESGSAAERLLPHDRAGDQDEPRRAAAPDQRGLPDGRDGGPLPNLFSMMMDRTVFDRGEGPRGPRAGEVSQR